ncbi:MAG: type II toxin-antitoxin system RelE/ParE family toxin [Candidatus Wildermuthbacteria bacterium]|nr:type II toxin-antitoxin system RelE/ParE family toxin [Candidatus Wildermuthbacteria bacterium]
MKIKEIRYSSKFEKEYRALPIRIKKIAERKEELFRENAFHPTLKTHKLQGGLKEFYSFSINREYRIIFEFADSDVVWFHSVGDHSIYQMFD